MGLNAFNLAGGSIDDDFDGDGWLDIVTSSWDPVVQMLYFHGEADGSFTERGEEAGLAGRAKTGSASDGDSATPT